MIVWHNLGMQFKMITVLFFWKNLTLFEIWKGLHVHRDATIIFQNICSVMCFDL